MITLRKAQDRGRFDHGWLNTAHTFSFSDYYDPRYMGFRDLRVINEDRVQPGQGFNTHPHQDMEILSYVLDGALEHHDSMGNGSVIKAGDVQRMSAGTGVLHSEFNHSKKEQVHFLQIWIVPGEMGLPPSYEQKSFSEEDRKGKLHLIAGPDGDTEHAVTIHQDIRLYTGSLGSADEVNHTLAEGRHAWIQVTKGELTLNGSTLHEGDGAAVSEETRLKLNGQSASEFLLFDLI